MFMAAAPQALRGGVGGAAAVSACVCVCARVWCFAVFIFALQSQFKWHLSSPSLSSASESSLAGALFAIELI